VKLTTVLSKFSNSLHYFRTKLCRGKDRWGCDSYSWTARYRYEAIYVYSVFILCMQTKQCNF